MFLSTRQELLIFSTLDTSKDINSKGAKGDLIEYFSRHQKIEELIERLDLEDRVQLGGIIGSLASFLVGSVFKRIGKSHLVILSDRERAAYFLNDLEGLIGKNNVFFFPASGTNPYSEEGSDNASVLLRAEVLSRISKNANENFVVVTYPEAIAEKVVTKAKINQSSFDIRVGESVDVESMLSILVDYGFDRVDFVIEPGQFSIRGGIIDVFSFAHDEPFRIELFDDEVESIRTFDIESQLSITNYGFFRIVPNVQTQFSSVDKQNLLSFLGEKEVIWMENQELVVDVIQQVLQDAYDKYDVFKSAKGESLESKPNELYISPVDLKKEINARHAVLFQSGNAKADLIIESSPQPAIRKNFSLLINSMRENQKKGYKNILFSETKRQIERLYSIFEDLDAKVEFTPIYTSLYEGFISHDHKLSVYTDHQIFERFQQYRLKSQKLKSKTFSLKILSSLKKGDFVTHIDHGIGVFDGLEILEANGKRQEAVRLRYKNNDLLYVSINSLHRISKYSASEGKKPQVNKLGSDAWRRLKSKTKSSVKKLAIDLVKLYAKRKAKLGFAFSPDSYLQNELEASFIYEDTPDQEKATDAVKADMEKSIPMDRLVCGDVGFGKTEIAVRAAFKAVTESKQVAIMVPTTILALQHFRTFTERLKDFPCTVDYLNRFRSSKDQKRIIKELEEGKIDILIGTHKIAGSSIKFKDLGLLVIDEEQKFGVGIKEKLKTIRINVDTLTLTATPIPRTLQFSLMGARDLSIINTPPPNRQPVQTELVPMNEDQLRDVIMYEVERNGQVFFVHNRVKNIKDIAVMIEKICPEVSIGVAHGQMQGSELEDVLVSFIDGEFDLLVSTNIIESGLDIPNANTIIINQAQNFGLSDLHQMRGRVGRSNIKAFCYLVVPPLSTLSSDARRRLRAVEEFSELGSGFNISLRDLDIRGAGNLLGGEQSGFISEIGLETYQKILDEAISELRETEYSNLFADQPERPFVSDCQVESDYEALIPHDYVKNTPERLELYMALDNCSKPEDLAKFLTNLEDRFGKIPPSVLALTGLLALRELAKSLGIEKLILKKGKMLVFFISSANEKFYQSEQFGKVLKYLQTHPNSTKMQEKRNRAMLSLENISNPKHAKIILEKILAC